jgi:hypothetical protein
MAGTTSTSSADAKRLADEAHRHHLQTDGENVPDEIRGAVLAFAGEVGACESRGDLMATISAAYAVTGEWENFLAGDR